MDRLTKEQFHKQALQIRNGLADAVGEPRDAATSVVIDKALAQARFYAQTELKVGTQRNAVDLALEQFSAELISLMLTYAAGELPEGFDKLPRPF
jgi:hypothetical protein